MNRRSLVRLGAGLAVAAPLALAREVVRPDRTPLPRKYAGEVLTASAWNAVVDRINELSEAP